MTPLGNACGVIGTRSLKLVHPPPRDDPENAAKGEDTGEDTGAEVARLPLPKRRLHLCPSPDSDASVPLAGLAARFR